MKILIYDSGIGLIPILSQAIRQNKLHEYYVYMEAKYFPLGEKSSDFLQVHVRKLFARWNKEGYQIVIIACNTFATVLREIALSAYQFTVYDILSCNIGLYQEDTLFLATKATSEFLLSQGYSVQSCSFLVPLIEERKMPQLMLEIKELSLPSTRVILGCTHFHHLDPLFRHFHPRNFFLDGNKKLISQIPYGDFLRVTGNKKGQKYLKKFFSSHILSSTNL